MAVQCYQNQDEFSWKEESTVNNTVSASDITNTAHLIEISVKQFWQIQSSGDVAIDQHELKLKTIILFVCSGKRTIPRYQIIEIRLYQE